MGSTAVVLGIWAAVKAVKDLYGDTLGGFFGRWQKVRKTGDTEQSGLLRGPWLKC